MARSLFFGLVRRAASAVFHVDDEFARHQRWQVRAGRLGLSRSYRHPGFDLLATCPDCAGSGQRGDVGCGRCSRTGRVMLGQPAQGHRGGDEQCRSIG